MWSSRVRRPTGISKKYNVQEYKRFSEPD